MELLKNMIVKTYPDTVIKDISDVAIRIKDWKKIHKLMLTLTVKDNSFVVCEIHDKFDFSEFIDAFNEYNTNIICNEPENIKFIVMRKPHMSFLPISFGTKSYDNLNFQRVLNTLFLPYEESASCTICYKLTDLGADKKMCQTCYKSVCEECFIHYIIKSGNPGWCPTCKSHLVFTDLTQPDTNDPMADKINYEVREEMCRIIVLSALKMLSKKDNCNC